MTKLLTAYQLRLCGLRNARTPTRVRCGAIFFSRVAYPAQRRVEAAVSAPASPVHSAYFNSLKLLCSSLMKHNIASGPVQPQAAHDGIGELELKLIVRVWTAYGGPL